MTKQGNIFWKNGSVTTQRNSDAGMEETGSAIKSDGSDILVHLLGLGVVGIITGSKESKQNEELFAYFGAEMVFPAVLDQKT